MDYLPDSEGAGLAGRWFSRQLAVGLAPTQRMHQRRVAFALQSLQQSAHIPLASTALAEHTKS